MRRLAATLLVSLAACSPSGTDDGATSTCTSVGLSTTTSTPVGWVELTPMETARSEHPAVVLDGEIVVLGGLVETGVGRTGVTPTVEAYDPRGDAWRALPALPQPRHHGMAAVVDGRLFFIGGYTPGGNPSAAVWELVDEAWRDSQPLPAPVAAGAAVSVAEAVYVVGGVPAGSFYRYDVGRGQWVVLPAPTTQREHLATTILEGELWAIAGRWMGEIFATTEVYDPGTETWRAGPSLSEPRSGFGAAVSGGGIIVAGGEVFDPDRALSDVEVLDGGRWQVIDPLPHGLHGNPLVALADHIYLPGGSTRAAGVANDGATFRLDAG